MYALPLSRLRILVRQLERRGYTGPRRGTLIELQRAVQDFLTDKAEAEGAALPKERLIIEKQYKQVFPDCDQRIGETDSATDTSSSEDPMTDSSDDE